MKGQCHFS